MYKMGFNPKGITILTHLFSLFLIIFLLLANCGVSMGVGSELAAALQTALDESREAAGIIGVTMAVIIPEEGMWLGASGVSDLETGTAMVPENLLVIGSITKTFVSALILQLAEEGKLTLEDSIEQWLPGLVPNGEKITVRQLLNHTSGIVDFMELDEYYGLVGSDLAKAWEPEETVALATSREPYFEPGTGMKYSSTNYILLGMIVEAATGSTLSNELRSRLLEPLKLNNTYLAKYDEVPGETPHGYWDFDFDGNLDDIAKLPSTTSIATTAWAGGGMVSNAEDLARWADALYSGQVLSEASMNELLTFVEELPGVEEYLPEKYGLGVVRYELPLGTAFGHDGRHPGFYSLMQHLPEPDITIVMLMNQWPGPNDIVDSVMQQLTVPPVVDTEANKAIVRRSFEEVWDQANLAVVDEIFATDFVSHDPVMPISGTEAYKQNVTVIRAAFPNLHYTLEDMVAEGDMVATRWMVTGTHQGEFMGIPPTDVQGTATGIDIFRIADGKIVEVWSEWDVLGMMQQFGVIPPDREDYTWGEPSEVTGDPGDPKENKALIRRWAEETWNQGNVDAVDEFFATDFVNHSPSEPDVLELSSYKQWSAAFLAAFPDFNVTIEDMFAEGDKVVSRWTVTGTHKGDSLNIPATGKQVKIPGMHIYRFASGKIVEMWWSSDSFGFRQQLGIIPPMVKDFSNVFFMPLTPGLNMVSLPLEPQTPYTARSFVEKLSATTVIKLDESRQRFVGFTLDAPDDGFAIEGGKGYIVNVPKGGMVAFTGAAWTRPPMPAAPAVQTDGAWAFVVSGRFFDDSNNRLEKDSYLVTVRNTRTNAVTTDVVRSKYFATAFADLNRQNVVQTGDRLELQVRNRAGEIVSDTLTYTVTSEAIHQALLPVTLKNVEIPRQSLLLQNYPNPFNPETWIPYQIREPAEVLIRIYSAQGRLVRTLDLGQRAAGFYLGRTRAAYWDGCNDAGEKIASGVYFYTLRTKDFTATRKMIITK